MFRSHCGHDMQQLVVQPEELDAIVARLSTQPTKDSKKQLEQSHAVKLVFAQDTAKGKGYKETFQPVKRVSWKMLSSHEVYDSLHITDA